MAFAREQYPAILESVVGTRRQRRFSILACDQIETLVVPHGSGRDPFAALQHRLGSYPAITPHGHLPFLGGWIGFLGYEAGLGLEGIEPTPRDGAGLPTVRMGLYDAAAVFDHGLGAWSLVAVDWPSWAGIDRPPAEHRLERLEELLNATGAARPPPQPGFTEAPRPDWSWPEYAAKVAVARGYIAAGDVYQVNLTQRFTAHTTATPLELYLALRSCNPADYAALLAWEDQAVISSSPELFLDLRGRRVRTRPIKGTRPRTGDAVLDPIRRAELAASPKDEAELNMIIDLLRNDLGKVCAYGTVTVDSAGDIEAHPTVFHRVATLSGRLRPECGPLDLLRATFPGGSVTGAPKIRAMRIIDELETSRRGPYCGAIGYLGLDGAMCFNMAIRTMVLDGGVVHIHAGGAIVADSDAEEEYEETLAKAEGMFRALRAVGQDAPEGAETRRFR